MSTESSIVGIREATVNVQLLHINLMSAWGGPGNLEHVPILRGLLGNIGIGKRVNENVSAVDKAMLRDAPQNALALWGAWLSLWTELRTGGVPNDALDESMVLLVLGSGVLYWSLLPYCGKDFPLTAPTGDRDGWIYRDATTVDGERYVVPQPTVGRTGPVDEVGRLLKLCKRPTTNSENIEALATRLRDEMIALAARISGTDKGRRKEILLGRLPDN